MDHHVLGAFDGLKGFLNDVGAGLGEHLDVHIVGDQMVLDDGPQKFILGLGGGGEAYLNLFEPHVQQEAVKGQLFLQILMGSISAWLPSRRSTLHQAGASVSRSFLTQSIQGSGGM